MNPDRGEIWHLAFDPASGREMKGDHFCLVVSPRAFNARFKLAVVCPISGGVAETARSAGFLVSLMGQGLRTDGQVHVHQLKSLDLGARRATFVERIPDVIVQEVLECLQGIFE